MTGLYNWQAGIGHLIEDWLSPGYTPYLNRNCVTIAEVLRSAGYGTYMVGKWHIGGWEINHLPCQRGFDCWFGTLGNGSAPLPDYGGFIMAQTSGWTTISRPFHPADTTATGSPITHCSFCGASVADNAPFFLYVAFRAPACALTAPPEGVEKYRQNLPRAGRFTGGSGLPAKKPWAL